MWLKPLLLVKCGKIDIFSNKRKQMLLYKLDNLLNATNLTMKVKACFSVILKVKSCFPNWRVLVI